MKLSQLLLSATLASLGAISLLTPQSYAASFKTLDGFTDSDFGQLINDGDFTELFVAESRIGNNQVSGDRELGINTKTGSPVAQGQRKWNNGEAVDFTLEYTGNVVNYTVGGQLLSSTAFSGPVTDIFLRTRTTDDASMSLTDLVLDGMAIDDLVSSTLGTGDNSDVDYLQIGDLSGPFTLAGKSMMTWTEDTDKLNGSQLAYQIKVGTTPETTTVPEPSAILALSLGAGVFGMMKQKRDRKPL